MQYGTRRSRVLRFSACEIVAYDSKIVFGYVRELWAAGAFAQRPHIWRTHLQSAIDANVTASVQFNAGLPKSNSSGVRNAPDRDQDVAAIDALLTGRGAHSKRYLASRPPKYLKELGLDKNFNGLVAENAPHLPSHVDILASHELRTGLDDGDIAAEATIGLCEFQTSIASTDHDQVLWQIIELQRLDVREGLSGFQAGNIRDGCVRSDI
jgi:hypothetical protein